VFVRLSTRVSHSQSLVELCDRKSVELKPYEKNIGKYVMMPANAIKRHVVVEERTRALTELAESFDINTAEYGKRVGVITAGVAYMYAREALGESVDFLKLGMVYPLPEKLIRDFAAAHDEIYVIEELDPFIEEHCKALGIAVKGKELFTKRKGKVTTLRLG
jgi:indolepyruvate ferredoxin oxidoreductase alpha subunit